MKTPFTPSMPAVRCLLHVLVVALLAGLRLSAATADRTPYYVNCANTIATSNPDWMSYLADDLPIWSLSLPATHDTMTYNFGEGTDIDKFVKDQTLSLETQLAAGIRFLDIRLWQIDDYKLECHHGGKDLGFQFSDVLSKVNAFLSAHPTETVMMNVQHEGLTGGGSQICTDCTKTFEETFLYYRDHSGYGGRIWKGPFTNWPTLGTVRGKILVFGNAGFVSDDVSILLKTSGPYFEAPNSDGHAYELTNNRSVNDADKDDPDNSDTSFWEKKRRSLVAALCHAYDDLNYPITWRFTGLNGYTTRLGLGSALPFMVAGGIGDACTIMCNCDSDVYSGFTGMNEHALDFLRPNGGANDFLSCGVVSMDYPGWKLIDSIIAKNPIVFVMPSAKPSTFPLPYPDGLGNSKTPFWTTTNAIGKAVAAIPGINQCSVTPSFTLRVETGTYRQNVSFNKPLRLLPVGGTVRIGTR